MVFCQHFVIQYFRTQSLTCENLKFLMLFYSHQHEIKFPSLMLLFAAFVLLCDLSHKNA